MIIGECAGAAICNSDKVARYIPRLKGISTKQTKVPSKNAEVGDAFALKR